MIDFNKDQLEIIKDSWEGISLIVSNIIEPNIEVAKNQLETCEATRDEDLLNKGELRFAKDILHEINQIADRIKRR